MEAESVQSEEVIPKDLLIQETESFDLNRSNTSLKQKILKEVIKFEMVVIESSLNTDLLRSLNQMKMGIVNCFQ